MNDTHVEEPSNEELRAITRRSALRLLGGAGLAVVAACATDLTSTSATTGTTAAFETPTTGTGSVTTASAVTNPTFGGAGSCVLVPEETEGPYPLDLSGSEEFFRSDITEGKEGIPLTMNLVLVDVNNGCNPVSGARVDVWHCDAAGVYSGYSQPGTDTTGETFCRGIQLSDANGQVTFQTIYPGWYQGRVTHIHFQVFLESGLAATSQIAFPEDITRTVYEVEPYAAKGQNASVASNAADGIFADGTQYQLATITGGVDTRLVGSLLVGIASS